MQNETIPDRHMAAYEKIHSSGINLLGIINDILDLTKIETGKMELNPFEYDVPSLINDAIQLNIVRIGSKPIEFKLSVDENLPTKLYGDEIRIKQILNNLLSNAIKYTEKGQIHLSVNHSIINEDIILVLSVSDTGQGMKEEDIRNVFDEYARFNTETNRSIEGTGLGLNIIKRIAEMMEGDISVESELGKGSTFTVTIKQKSADNSPIGEELAQQLSNFTFTSKKQNNQEITREMMPYGSVLVVDDVEINLYVASEILLSYDLEVEMADSGFAVLDKIENGKKYDVIFMDHMMPKMDGIETTKKLRELGYTGFIVALTANALVGNDKIFAKNGFDGFIAKPIDIKQINTILNKFVRDMHPEEAKKYKSDAVMQNDNAIEN
jgi:CheY-like chemotaxis protein